MGLDGDAGMLSVESELECWMVVSGEQEQQPPRR